VITDDKLALDQIRKEIVQVLQNSGTTGNRAGSTNNNSITNLELLSEE
jgi:hypothetical protein